MTNTVERSVNLRLTRAEKHLKDVERLVQCYRASEPYTVACDFERKKREFVYRLRQTEQPDEQISVIIGDFLHNVRAALNYCMAGLVQTSRASKTQFPIMTGDNPFARERPGGKYLQRNPERRRQWRSWVKGADPNAIAIIEKLQPYHSGWHNMPTYLGILNSQNNSDKHHRLSVVSTGVTELNYLAFLNGVMVGNGMQADWHLLQDGTEIFRHPSEVDMKIEYAPHVAIRVGEQSHIPLEELRALLELVRNDAVARLIPYLRR